MSAKGVLGDVLVAGVKHPSLNSGALDFDPDESQVEKWNHTKKTTVEVSMMAGPRLRDAQVANGRRSCKAAFGRMGKAAKGNSGSFIPLPNSCQYQFNARTLNLPTFCMYLLDLINGQTHFSPLI